jgi:CheY-like chemotaxis protein
MTKPARTLPKEPKGSFIFIDDKPQELILLKEAMKELRLKNKTHCFRNGLEALHFLKNTEEDIFLIISDIDMPGMDGLQLKRLIELTPEIKIKAIPFVFHSQSVSATEVRAAYASNIQGYLRKAHDLEGTVTGLYKLVALWTDCIHPKDF